jgi:hypothetical protein
VKGEADSRDQTPPVTRFDLDNAAAMLARTPPLLDAWLRDLPEVWLHARETPESWSPFDIVGHLIHGEETDWIPRARIILEHGELRTFEPFDRVARVDRTNGQRIGPLLDTLSARRTASLEALRGFCLVESDLARSGRHPEFGRVTLGQLLAAWVVHDLTHVRQIARALARQYSVAVGPWKAYLSVLHE